MGIGFKLNLKLGSTVPSPFRTNPSSRPSSYPSRGRETSYDSGRVSFASSWQSENPYNDSLKAHTCLSALLTLENDFSEMEELKAHNEFQKLVVPGQLSNGYSNISLMVQPNTSKKHDGSFRMLGESIQKPIGEDTLFHRSPQASKASQFGLLVENLDRLEATFADSDVVRLEEDILVQLERIGALNIFRACLRRTLQSPTLIALSKAPTQQLIKDQSGMVYSQINKVIVHSSKKEERKLRRERALEKASGLTLPSKSIHKDGKRSSFSLAKKPSTYKKRRLVIARNEVEMSKGFKLLENLEDIRLLLEEETGKVASLSSWAEAAGVDKKVLQQHLHHGWYCRDELLRSTRSLIIYLARSYRGLGVGFVDLIQAGKFGVLQGAVRFDHNRGYRFSTYVQYWIRKSMSALVALHSRGIRVPFNISKAINKIQRARKALSSSRGTFPNDDEIAKFTGLSVAKINSASKCLKVVGSIDQKIGDDFAAKYMEFMADESIMTPEEAVTRANMAKELHDLLNSLDPKERQVLMLRFGLRNHPRMSLEEIGRLFKVSKEWIRRMECRALTKLRDEETRSKLRHYLYL